MFARPFRAISAFAVVLAVAGVALAQEAGAGPGAVAPFVLPPGAVVFPETALGLGTYHAMRDGANIYIVTLTRHTPLPPVVTGPNQRKEFEQVELQVVKSLHGQDQEKLSLQVQTVNEYGGRGGGIGTSSLAWAKLPQFKNGQTLLLVLPLKPTVDPENNRVLPSSWVEPVTGENDPKVKVWLQLVALSETKPADRLKAYIAAADTVDPRIYMYLEGAATERLSLRPEAQNAPEVLSASDGLAILTALLMHAGKSNLPLTYNTRDVVTLMENPGVTDAEKLATAKAMALASGSGDPTVSRDVVVNLWVLVYQFGGPGGVDLNPDKLLAADERRALEGVLTKLHDIPGGTSQGGTVVDDAGLLLDWLHGKPVPHPAAKAAKAG